MVDTHSFQYSHRAGAFWGGGETGALIAAHDWAASSLGPIESWPEALVGAVRLMLPAASEIVLFWGPDYIALYNDAFAPTIGTKHPGALGRPAQQFWRELWDDLGPLLAHVRTTGETFSAKDRPFYIERQGFGEEVFFDVSCSAIRHADGAIGGVLCIVTETSERVLAARTIAADRARLSEMFDQAPGFMAVLREPGHVFELINSAFITLVGHRDLIGCTVFEALPEIDPQGFVALLDTVAETGRPYRGTDVAIRFQRDPDGPIKHHRVDFICQPITSARGVVTGIFIEGADVTERHEAERQLALSRESLIMATDAAEVGTWDLDLRTDTLDWSDRTKAMFGISLGVPCSMEDFYAGLHPDDLAATSAAFAAAIDPAERSVYDVVYRTVGAEDGVVRWIAARGRGVFDGDICVRALGTTLDITRHRAIDEDLRETEARFRQLADTAPALIWVTDDQANVTFANRWFETAFGMKAEAMHVDGWQRIIPDEDWDAFAAQYRATFVARAPWSVDVRVVDAQGVVRWMHAEGRPRLMGDRFEGYIGCAIDVTEAHLAAEALERGIAERTAALAETNRALTEQIAERERVEATLHQVQRLDAVGQLTSGVAHDFNNLLTIVLGNVGMVERVVREAGLDGRTIRRLEHVRTAAERGATLTAQLLAFARRTRLEAKALDLNGTVAGMRDLLDSSLGGSVLIETRLQDDLWPALVDPTQIELIILNLAINARDAMEVGGTLRVETANVALGDPFRAEEPAAGEYVMVAVSDTGSGMSDAVRARAFEPFFTTKPVGKGSGLGLAQVFGFAKQSGGGVRIDTAIDAGTTVRVFLPRAAASEAYHSREDEGRRKAAGNIAGRTLLVLDDDDAVRAVTVESISGLGCRIVEAADGAAALRALTAEPEIALAIVDFAMPGMNGAEFARQAMAVRPDLLVLFVTGYADLAALADIPDERLMRKPYRMEALAERVRDLLGR